eukprot:TCALIF_07487-PA protein Name:"Protein of unknown function" AED:0.42 eAED:0.49 QI:0/-1/0/1/-1/1/1/0/211
MDNTVTFSINALPDTGANETIMATKILDQKGLTPDASRAVGLHAANGTPMQCDGAINLRFKWYDRETVVIVYASPQVSDTLISWHALLDLDIIPKSFPMSDRICSKYGSQVCSVEQDPGSLTIQKLRLQLIKEYPTVFNDLAKLKPMVGPPMKIHIRKNVADEDMPNPCTVARKIPHAFRDATKLELNKMIDEGIIRQVHEPTKAFRHSWS